MVAALGVALPAAAQPQNELPLWEVGVLGAGGRQPAYPGAADSVGRGLVLPYVVYRGPLLRIDRGTAALRAFKTRELELDIGFSGSLGSSSNDVSVRRGMPDLGTLVEFGPRLTWKLSEDAAPGAGRWRVELPVRGVFDLSNSLAQRGIAVEPELSYARRTQGGLGYSVGVGAVWGNRRLADTLYGVAPGPCHGQSPGLCRAERVDRLAAVGRLVQVAVTRLAGLRLRPL
jgi:MipA family protein